MIKNILNILSKFTFKNIFGTIVKRFFKIFFSDRRTASILKFLGLIFGSFRLFNALIGFLVLINLETFKTFKDLPEAIYIQYKILRNNIYQAINKFWPTHPSIPQEIQSSIRNIERVPQNPLPEPNPEIQDKIVEDKPFSLRELYNKYIPYNWKDLFSKNESPVETPIDTPIDTSIEQVVNHYSLFSDWKFYIGCVLLAGLLYILVPFAYSKLSYLNHKKDLDAPGAAEAISEDIIPVRFFKTFYRFISSIVERINPNSRTLPRTPERQYPDAPTNTPISTESPDSIIRRAKDFIKNIFTSPQPPQSDVELGKTSAWMTPLNKGKGRAKVETELFLNQVDKDINADGSLNSPETPTPSASTSGYRQHMDPNLTHRDAVQANLYSHETPYVDPFAQNRKDILYPKVVNQMDTLPNQFDDWSQVKASNDELKFKELLNSLVNPIPDDTSSVYSEVGTDLTPGTEPSRPSTPSLTEDKTSSSESDISELFNHWLD